MENKKISELTSASSVTGNETSEIVQGGVNKKVTKTVEKNFYLDGKTDTVTGNESDSTAFPSTKGLYDYLTEFVWHTASIFGTWISGLTGKTTPVDADTLVLSDSAASNASKKLTWANLKATLKTYFDGLSFLDQTGSKTFAVASGTDTYTAALTPSITSYGSGNEFLIQFTNANTSTTPTININGLGAKTIVKRNNAALIAGDIAAGQIYKIAYDGTNFRILGVANTAELTDVILSGQSGTGLRFALLDANGKVTRNANVSYDNSTGTATINGLDNLDASYSLIILNQNGDLIARFSNGRFVQYGGTSFIIEVDSSITSGNARIIANDNQAGALTCEDRNGDEYWMVRSTTGNKAFLIKQIEEFGMDSQGWKVLREPIKFVLPNTTAATAHIVKQISIPSDYACQITIENFIAYATDGSVIQLAAGANYQTIVKNVGGTTSKASGDAQTLLGNPATTALLDIVANNTNDRADITFTNNTGTGKQWTIFCTIKYTLIPVPV